MKIKEGFGQFLMQLLKYIFLGGILICVIVIFLITPEMVIPTVFPLESEYNPDSPIWVLSIVFWVLLFITGLTIIYGIYQRLTEPKYPEKPPIPSRILQEIEDLKKSKGENKNEDDA